MVKKIELEDLMKKLSPERNQKKISKPILKKAFLVYKRMQNSKSISHKLDSYEKIKKTARDYFKLSKEFSDKDFICPICYDFLINPKTTICGHSFCDKCFCETMLKFDYCAICKTKIKNFSSCFSKSFDKAVKRYISSLEPKFQNIYQ